ncbi:septin [Pichia kluyveri]|uniref:Septin n=1 Tax=Pichia kluyveri TaxID=36015 RepID=A0AAV5R1W1_PICKL|nr:septin [Pichia kluyveri]
MVVDSINVVTPQSAMNGEDKINVDTVVSKSMDEQNYNIGISRGSDNFDFETETDNEFEFKHVSNNQDLINSNHFDNEDDQKNGNLIDKYNDHNHNHNQYNNDIDNNNVDVETLNDAHSEDLKFQKYHYNYASAIDDMDSNDIGLVCFPIQKRLQVYKKGSNFTILCVGESGTGKSSFVNTLFNSLLMENKQTYQEDFEQNPTKTTKITHHKMDLIEDGFRMRLNVIDTPGFGDYIDNKFCWYPITRYIDEQYRRLVYQESQPDRSNLVHSEVHACLYFIVPSAIGLSALDIDAMRNLSSRVNLIPIISKADGFTSDELSTFKQRIRNTLKEENIPICELIEEKSRIRSLINEMPFATINSIEYHVNEEGKNVRGRKYNWGLSEVENPEHCDFLLLRDFLIESYMGDLISSTESYYENYRKDFMRYRLGKAISLTINEDEVEKLGIKEFNKEVIVPSSRGSWKSVTKDNSPSHPSLDHLIEEKDSIEILDLLNRITITDTEKELVELNPSYLELEKQVKKKFTGVVQMQNQKFKDWKRTLYEKQDKFNKDIEQVHQRMVILQETVKSMDYMK